MRSVKTIFGTILFVSTIMASCNGSITESDGKSEDVSFMTGSSNSSSKDSALSEDMGLKVEQEEALQNSKSDFLTLFLGNTYTMGEGENMVTISFDTSGYFNDCGDLGQVGWVGSYWADGPLFTVDVNVQEKELATHQIVNCTIDSKETYKIKYIDDNTISLTALNCEDDFFGGCGPFILKN